MTTAPLRTRLAWIGGLSFASGLPYFLFNETIPLWLTEQGMSLTEIGLATGASLPWVFKFLWAPAVDRLGSRRTWIRTCLVLLAGGASRPHHARLDGAPTAAVRDSLAAIARSGERVTWSGAVSALAAMAEGAREPQPVVRVSVVSDAFAVLGDTLGVLDSLGAGGGTITLAAGGEDE